MMINSYKKILLLGDLVYGTGCLSTVNTLFYLKGKLHGNTP